MPLEHLTPESLCELLDTLCSGGSVSDAAIGEDAKEGLAGLCARASGPAGWQQLSMFWPPRLVGAYQTGLLVPFFGAGLSMGAGVPSWSAILIDHLRMDRSLS